MENLFNSEINRSPCYGCSGDNDNKREGCPFTRCLNNPPNKKIIEINQNNKEYWEEHKKR